MTTTSNQNEFSREESSSSLSVEYNSNATRQQTLVEARAEHVRLMKKRELNRILREIIRMRDDLDSVTESIQVDFLSMTDRIESLTIFKTESLSKYNRFIAETKNKLKLQQRVYSITKLQIRFVSQFMSTTIKKR
jgi:hypothetical protein